MDSRRSAPRSNKGSIYLLLFFFAVVYIGISYWSGLPTLAQITGTFTGLLTFQSELIDPKVTSVIGDAVLFFIALVVFLGFFAQFVLPLHNLDERMAASSRLLSYLFGYHGPAIFIENGDITTRKHENLRRGPGVILLDTASAAVLRTTTRFTRPIGPGTVFTNKNEYIAGTVDLHRQTQFIGPWKADDPFGDQLDGESDDEYRARQERRWETSGLTRDGVEIIPNIIAIFRLDSEFGEGGTQFGYNANSVYNAITRQSVDSGELSNASERRKSWKWLPAYMAADLWREYLRKFTLNEIFQFSQFPDDKVTLNTAFETISSQIRVRMTAPEADELDDIGGPTGRKIHSREYDILRQHGISIIAIVIKDLRFPKAVEKRLIDRWKPGWETRANTEARYVQQRLAYEKRNGQQTGVVDFAAAASRVLGSELLSTTSPDDGPDLSKSLEMLVRGTLEQCVSDPELYQYLTNEKSDLDDVLEWIRRN